MKILIAGAGAVGTHLAKLLSRERHDITLMDPNPERLEDISANFDILTLPYAPSSISALKEAEVSSADLFIGVTPDEAHNMTACMLASKLGAKKTVARVDNSEYVLPENREFFQSVGIDSIIYPEMLAAEEILHNIKRTWVRQWWEVQNGALILLGVKLRGNAQILNVPLRTLSAPDAPYHITAIKRGAPRRTASKDFGEAFTGETIIPHGNDCLCQNDVVYFMTTPKYINYIRDLAGKEDYPDTSNIIIMGGGSTTVHLANHMPEHMHAKIIEADHERARKLNERIYNPHTLILHGDGRDLNLLEEEGIRKTQAFIALTENSETNILACLAAKRLGVRKTVAMIENTDYISMAESLEIGTIINKKTFAANHIYQMMLKADVTSFKSLMIANADVAEFQTARGARITSHAIKDLSLPESVTLGGLVREGEGILINGNTRVQAGDTVLAFCLPGGIKKIEKYFR